MNPKTKTKIRGYLIYTALFAVTVSTVLVYFWRYQKSMVWDCDGLYQHFNSFVYYGEYLRGILKNLLQNHTLSAPMWDMSIGYGADVLTTLNYYVIGDPLALLSVFASPEKAEYMYGFVAVLRLYLSGFCFLVYCRYHKNDDVPAILGALLYSFSGWAVYNFARHPFFVNPMIYFPLLLLGIDKIFDGKKPWVFVLTTAVSALSNFYFFYMLCLMMFLYAVFRYLMIFRRIRIGELAVWLLRFIGWYLLGLGIAAVFFLPSAMYLLGTDRMAVQNDVPLLYPLAFYQRLIREFFHTDYSSPLGNYNTILGILPVAAIGMTVLLVKMKKNRALKTGFLLLSLILCVPFAGHVINGFSYVSNRWVWAYDMLFAYSLVKAWPELDTLGKKERAAVLLLVAGYCAAVFCMPGRTVHICIILLTLLLLAAAVCLCGKRLTKKMLTVLFFGMTTFSVAMNAYYLYAPEQIDYIDDFRAQGKPYEMLTTGSECYPVKELEDESGFYRYDSYGVVAHENTALQTRMHGTDFYFSVSNGAVSRFFEDLGVCVRVEQMYDNLDGRTILDRLAAVKYFVVKDGKEELVPYSYDTLAGGNEKWKVWQSSETLPFGYTYEYQITQETYDSLTYLEKQQALLQGAVVQESALPEAQTAFDDVRLQAKITPNEKVAVDGNRFKVKKGGQVTFTFEGLPDSELYLVMENVEYQGKASSFSLRVAAQDVEKKIPVYTNSHPFYSGKDDFVCNVGYNEEAQTELTLTFSAAGTYTFGDIYVACQPMTAINGQTAQLRRDVLEDVEFSDNRITGTISLEQDKMLVLSMAYSEGWTVFVDGEEQELKQVNVMYCGLELSAGEHHIELRYRTPWLTLGALISLGSIVLALILAWAGRRRSGVQTISKNTVKK